MRRAGIPARGHKGQGFRRLAVPALLSALLLALLATYPRLLSLTDGAGAWLLDIERARLVLGTAAGLALTWLASRMVELALTRAMARKGRRPSRLLQQLIGTAMFLAFLIAMLALVFDTSLIGALTTSGVLIAVIGFALRNIIADIFSGLALSLESPYRIGDWIEAETGLIGRVVEINWRSTSLRTRNDVYTVIPNSRIAAGKLVNYSAPRQHYRVELPIVLDFRVPVGQAKRILLAGVLCAPKVRSVPPPDISVAGYTERGIEYKVRYWVSSFADDAFCRDAVLTAIDRHLRVADVVRAHGRERVLMSRERSGEANPMEALAATLMRVPVFRSLPREDARLLAQSVRRRFVPAGERADTFMAGGADALLILVEGVVTITDGAGRALGTLAAGDTVSLADGWDDADAALASVELTTATGAILLLLPLAALRDVRARNPELEAELRQIDALADRVNSGESRAPETGREALPDPALRTEPILSRLRHLLG